MAGTLLGDEEADMEIYTVDATLATSADVVSKYGIEQYPSIRLIKGENMMKYEILNPDDMTEGDIILKIFPACNSRVALTILLLQILF